MAVVEPFHAVRFDPERTGPPESLVAPPYDVISPAEREELAGRSPYNAVHLTLPEDAETAGRRWREWLDEGVLVREDVPAVWELEQDYMGADGRAWTRRGIVASLRAEPYENGAVLPHERTHSGPKEDRLRLLRAVRAQLEPIFLIYEGPPPVSAAGPPDLEVEGARLRRVGSLDVEGFFARKQLLIADGHHRYETALAFHEEEGTDESTRILVVLVSTSDPALRILPTHRLAGEVDADLAPPGDGDPRTLLAELESEPRERAAAVVYRRGGASKVYGDEGELDVELVARRAADVRYTASVDEAVAAVDAGEAATAFLLRPLLVDQVFAVARRGDVMPQKSTYFHPKLLSGLLFHPLD